MLIPHKARLLGGLLLAGLIVVSAAQGDQASKKNRKRAPARPDATKTTAAGLLPDGTKLTAEQLAGHIDRLIEQKARAEAVALSERTSDAEFLRRVYLDLTGKIPTADKAAAFLDSTEPSKRARLIDELLASKDYGRHLADVWQALLLPRSSDTRFFQQYYPTMVSWLADQFNEGAGWDRITKEIVTASGEVKKTGPAVYWLVNGTPDKATDNVTRMFLGVQLQCAQCHNHPFTDWKQNEYWHMAAFFLKVRPDGNPRAAARNGGTIAISEKAGPRGKRGGLPPSAKILPPKFLGGEQVQVKDRDPVRPLLAEWMTGAKNPYFSKAMVNRTWGLLFGRGIVNPVDDMHEANPASHPELLIDLAKQFSASGFDVKYLLRALCNSRTYQRSSKPAGNNTDADPALFARMAVRPLTPEQLYDSLEQLTGRMGANGPGRRGGVAARFAGTPRDAFIAFFGIEDGADATEFQAGIPQVLRLMNSPQLNRAAALTPLLRDGKGRSEIVEKLYLTVLARRPTSEEAGRIDRYLDRNREDGRQAYAGVLWALMNSSEFALNR
jgi:hypothetical protein